LRPDVVIVDIILDGGGDEGLGAIHTLTRLRAAGKILAWSQLRDDYRQRAIAAGAIDCIHPAKADVIAAIQAVVKGEDPSSPDEIGEIRGLALHLESTSTTIIGTQGERTIRLRRADYFPILKYLATERVHNGEKWLSYRERDVYEFTQAPVWTQITQQLDVRTGQIRREKDPSTERIVHVVNVNFLAKFLSETNAQITPFLPRSAQHQIGKLLIIGPENNTRGADRYRAKPCYTLNHNIAPDMINLPELTLRE
jgi:hypothetical protein